MSKESTAGAVPGEIEILTDDHEQQTQLQVPEKWREVLGVVLGLFGLFLFLSLISYDGIDSKGTVIEGSNWMGMAGTYVAFVFFTLFGATAYLLGLFVWFSTAVCFIRKLGQIRWSNTIGMLFVGIFATIALHTMLRGETLLGGHLAGGFIGELLGELSISLFSVAGTYLLALGGTTIILLLITDVSLFLVGKAAAVSVRSFGAKATENIHRIIEAWQGHNEQFFLEGEKSSDSLLDTAKKPKEKKQKKAKKEKAPDECLDTQTNDEPIDTIDEQPKAPKGKKGAQEPKIVKKKFEANKAQSEQLDLEIDERPVKGIFQLPPLGMLANPPAESPAADVDERHLKKTADKLVKILADFNVLGEVREIHPGPVVTMFEFQPKSGTKLSKIENLSSELAMALEVMRVRVVAPIPGKNAVGFELPNKLRETVYLKEMLVDGSFGNAKLKLPMALGKDIAGTPKFVDLAKMPHLLIAGTTGSGKSVSLNAMLLSLLYKYTPEDLRLLLVDPKMVELGIYDGIPHLLLPVVSDMSKACLALKWAVDEMERRYQLFADLGVRNLESYNKKVAKIKAEHSALSEEEKLAKARENTGHEIDEEDNVVVVGEKADMPEQLEKMPFIVIVVDELADLMMVAAKDVETSIARLAQKARAAGLHLIIATQRPSVDVITGLIKANFPSRISFRVSSNHDSRTILGCNGAENLLGMGDMLVLPPGTSDLMRVHGAFVDDDEINQIVGFLKSQGTPEYDEEILKPREDEEGGGVDETEKDSVYDEAVAIVAGEGACSISMIQRRLRIGYNRAARIVEIMEKEGVVGPANGVNKREVLISNHG